MNRHVNTFTGTAGIVMLGSGIAVDSVTLSILAGIILLATGNLPAPRALDSASGMRDRAKRPE